jgi:hypothetical protein
VVPSLRVISVEHDSVCRNAGFFQGDIVQTVDGRTPASAEKARAAGLALEGATRHSALR